jgi:hypothetical protein
MCSKKCATPLFARVSYRLPKKARRLEIRKRSRQGKGGAKEPVSIQTPTEAVSP